MSAGWNHCGQFPFKVDDGGLGFGQPFTPHRRQVQMLDAPILSSACSAEQTFFDQPGHHADQIGWRNSKRIADLALVDAMIAVDQYQNEKIDRAQCKWRQMFDEFPGQMQLGARNLPAKPRLQPGLINIVIVW